MELALRNSPASSQPVAQAAIMHRMEQPQGNSRNALRVTAVAQTTTGSCTRAIGLCLRR